jgi:ABC-type branched-subunit amino acid transport system ATPase component
MNPQETIEITRFIRQLRDRFGLTILLIEHKLNLVREISDRVIVMDYGRRIAGGSYAEVACNPRVIDAYLGKQRSQT